MNIFFNQRNSIKYFSRKEHNIRGMKVICCFCVRFFSTKMVEKREWKNLCISHMFFFFPFYKWMIYIEISLIKILLRIWWEINASEKDVSVGQLDLIAISYIPMWYNNFENSKSKRQILIKINENVNGIELTFSVTILLSSKLLWYVIFHYILLMDCVINLIKKYYF